MPEIKPPSLSGSPNDWRKVYTTDEHWKRRLAELLDRVPDQISPNTQSLLESFIENLLKEQQE